MKRVIGATQNESGSSCEYYMGGIKLYLKKLRFKSRIFGVDPQDGWKKIEKLNEMYQSALLAERARFDRLLEAARTPVPEQKDETP